MCKEKFLLLFGTFYYKHRKVTNIKMNSMLNDLIIKALEFLAVLKTKKLHRSYSNALYFLVMPFFVNKLLSLTIKI